MTDVTVHFFETTMTRHGFIQAGSQVALSEDEAEYWIMHGYAKEIVSPEQAADLAVDAEKDRRKQNSRKLAERATE